MVMFLHIYNIYSSM